MSKKVKKMITDLLANELEAELHKRVRKARGKVVKERQMTQRQALELGRHHKLIPLAEDFVIEAEVEEGGS